MRINLTTSILLISNLTFAQQWHSLDSSKGPGEVVAMDIYLSSSDTIYAEGNWLMRSVDGGTHWDSIATYTSGDAGAVKVDPYNSKLLYVSSVGVDLESNDVHMSKDGGNTWILVCSGRVSPAPVVEIDPIDNTIVYVGKGPGLIMRSTDQGQTWDTIPEPPAVYAGGKLLSLAIAHSNDSVLYAGYSTGIFKSSDKGNSWQALSLGFGIHSGTCIAVNPNSSDTVYAGIYPSSNYSGGVYKSVDGGQSWKEANGGLSTESKQIITMTINPKSPDQLFIGLYGDPGLQGRLFWGTTDGGNQWTDLSEGLPVSGVVNCIDIDTTSNRIFCGVYSSDKVNPSALYVKDLVTVVRIPAVIIAKNFQLLQNYPNPFNPSTVIPYDVPTYSHVKIVVYDMLGRQIQTLVDDMEPRGSHVVVFNGSRLSSGVYLCQLISGRFVGTKKLILIK